MRDFHKPKAARRIEIPETIPAGSAADNVVAHANANGVIYLSHGQAIAGVRFADRRRLVTGIDPEGNSIYE